MGPGLGPGDGRAALANGGGANEGLLESPLIFRGLVDYDDDDEEDGDADTFNPMSQGAHANKGLTAAALAFIFSCAGQLWTQVRG